MPNPDRTMIEATVAVPTYKAEIWYPGNNTWIQLSNDSIIDISGTVESSGDVDNGLSFGTSVEPKTTLKTERLVVPTADKVLEDIYWLLKKVRISYGFSTSDFVKTFVGPIRERHINNNELTVELVSNLEYVRNTKFYSILYYAKPLATKTTASSVEDPTSGSYQAGIINRILWEAGGRPWEQESINYTETSAGFNFWYSCENSLLTPDWSWVSGENLIEELFTLARAGGGQIYQDVNGVVRYVQPFSFADTTGYGLLFIYTDSFFQSYSEKLTSYEQVGTVKCTFTPRTLQPTQVIYEDQIPRLFQPSESKTIELEMQWPIWEYENIISASQTTAQIFTSSLVDNNAVTPTIGTVTKYATKLEITVTNPNATTPMVIHTTKISGRPLSAGEERSVSYGSGDPERNVEDSPYIQSEAFAKKLVRMVYDFYATTRPIVTLNGAIYDTDRYVGEIVNVVSDFNTVYAGGGIYGPNTDDYRIVNIHHSATGTQMDVDLVRVTGLPTKSQMFTIGTAYIGSDTRKLSY